MNNQLIPWLWFVKVVNVKERVFAVESVQLNIIKDCQKGKRVGYSEIKDRIEFNNAYKDCAKLRE